ncbi:hypothetical protein H2200_005445 [Cladophialophora chaetospira]|uniref:Transmembrane protein n=1 Tax=Cladophialophora chaetospira TaxID=386627 RepID=A0AA38XC01_9EURO|nr:hypothetical protein H2200_005445 [Cladophialophora chaetospira]
MFEHHVHHNGKRAPQRHPPFNYASYGMNPPTPSPTIPPSTTDMVSTTSSAPIPAASETTTDVPYAAFIYPSSLVTFNNIDVVQVGYRTVWNSVNLTVFCELNGNSDEFALARINKSKLVMLGWVIEVEWLTAVAVQSNGTLAIAPIQAGMQIPQYPTYCNFMLCNADNSTDYTTGAGFTMISTQGVGTTYGLATTQTANTPSSSTQTSNLPALTATRTATSSSSVAASGPTESALASSIHSNGLSGGAQAGIAIGVILGVFALIAAAFFFLRMKRRIDKLENMVTLRSAASSLNGAPSEKPAMGDSTAAAEPMPSSPSPPPDGCGPRIEVFKIGDSHRNSEDWRRFFGHGRIQTPTAPS